ncbi:two-component system sensor histidine kinase NtrB [Chlamydia trachomatis]|uniref:histidine kinase n=1 Tax=Chlamydia trachomatis serovar A (strain A2497) TaxID=580047 RepID=G4NNL4_CHLT4|nr:histidine kinase dimerization/phospho-acceptor domain-containing protein [Chlamydia trachomatis]AEP35327.1 AtoS [Chlamydia trachomatis A2497]APD40148.1 PAS domain-containing sensor histidine kinase [Chlamydia trachomatis]CAX09136.1 two component regulator, histidine kinase [Chlamydia trachomatis A2497]CAX10030.1 two component regulator, histidine kinase [Chlamydia trachomatis B/TZ1A828/OT]CCP47860.1 sensory histidine kinase AtoS [Chlamydia trachomatis A/363]
MPKIDTCDSCVSNTELLAIRTRVTQSYNEAQTILSSIPDGIFLLSESGEILICNPQARAILGIPEDIQLVTRMFHDFFPDTFFGFSVQEALEKEVPPKTIRLTLSQELSQKEVEVFVRKNISHGFLFLLIRDRSDYRQLEQAIEKYRSISELGKIAATLAHEIRNPLTSISGFATLLKEELSSERHQRMLNVIIEGTRSLNSLVSSMLEYTKIQPLNLRSIDLQDFFSSLIPELSLTFPSCTFRRTILSPIQRSIDPDRLRCVIWNLVKNAVEASDEEIFLELHEKGFSVINTGTLPPNIQEKLFIPFFTTKPQGNGLGLAEAHKIMRLHGGDLVVSTQDNRTTFTILWTPA